LLISSKFFDDQKQIYTSRSLNNSAFAIYDELVRM